MAQSGNAFRLSIQGRQSSGGGNLPSVYAINLGQQTPRGFGGDNLGYIGPGTLSVLSDPSGLFSIDAENKLVISGIYGATPPALAGPYSLTISASDGGTQALTITTVANRYDVTSRAADTESSNQLRTILRDEGPIRAPGDLIVLRGDANFNPNRNGVSGVGGSWTIRTATNAAIAAAMTGPAIDVADASWVKITCETPLSAQIGGFQIDGTNQRKQGLWFDALNCEHLYTGAVLDGALLQFGTGINSYCSYIRVSDCSFKSNTNTTGQRSADEVLTGIEAATGTREHWYQDNVFDGLYDGHTATGNLSSSGHETEATNLWWIGNTYLNIWNDCRKSVECAPVYSRWNYAYDKKYGTGGLHGDFEQRLFNTIIAGVYPWGDFIGNNMIRAVGVPTWKEGQGLFQTCAVAGASFTGCVVEGNTYLGTFVRAFTIKNCTAPICRWNTFIQDQTTGIVNDTTPGLTTIYFNTCTNVDARYNASFNGILTEGSVTFAFNSQNVTTVLADYADAYLAATTIGASLQTIPGVIAALSMKPGGDLDAATTGFAFNVGAVGTGYVDFTNRTTSFPL